MLTVSAVGRVTADLELQTGKTSYVRFNLAVNKGFGENEHAVFLQCVLFDRAAERIVNAKVKKGSLIWVSGDLDVTEYEKADKTKEKSLKVGVQDWGYIPVAKPRADGIPPTGGIGYGGTPAAEIDGTREPLPY